MAEQKQVVLEQAELGRTIHRMAHEITEKSTDPSELVLIGIRSRGVHLARRFARKILETAKLTTPVGVIDVTSYRDDRIAGREAGIREFEVPVTVDDKTVVLVDDVIFRGRTIRGLTSCSPHLLAP